MDKALLDFISGFFHDQKANYISPLASSQKPGKMPLYPIEHAPGQPQQWYTGAPPNQNQIKLSAPKTKAQQYNPQFQKLVDTIQKGFNRYGSPMATAAADFAQAGYSMQQKYPKVDPLLAAVISLKETSGGKHMSPGSANNVLNIGPGINYPTIAANVIGGGTGGVNGGPQQGFLGTILNNPAYKKYLQSGNINDFFPSYTPAGGGNASIPRQVDEYNQLRNVFTQ